jgi:hypothetical protein
MLNIAAVLAFFIGGFSIVAGAMAMRGWNPGYSVLGWLPVYNFAMGILTILVPAILIWRGSPYAMTSAVVFCVIHVGVTALLLLAFRETVAIQSLLAMTFRVVVWLAILALLYFHIGGQK